MSSPFRRGTFAFYGGILPCVQTMIADLNEATCSHDLAGGTGKKAKDAGENGDTCSICLDTFGTSTDGSSPKLAIIMLPKCKHRFHEICIMSVSVFLVKHIDESDANVVLLVA